MMLARTAQLGRAVVKKDYTFPPAGTSSTAGVVFSEYQLEKCLKVAILCGLDVDVTFSVKDSLVNVGSQPGGCFIHIPRSSCLWNTENLPRAGGNH